MRNNVLTKWTQNNKLSRTTSSNSTGSGKPSWIHPSEALTSGHVVYLVKFLGRADVDQPKGIEMVKQGIQKLHFGQELKKSECAKLPKRELTISVNGVAIQDPKSKEILHQYPLHRISYCADDKGQKKFFSFIAKDAERESHSCFVFVSDKLAEGITLTIGQAFDLAYHQFLDTSGRDLDFRKQRVLLQKRLAASQAEAEELRRRLRDVSQLAPAAAVTEYCRKQLIMDLLKVSVVDDAGDASRNEVLHKNLTNGTALPPPVPARTPDTIDLISDFDDSSAVPSVGTRLEGLLLAELDSSFSSTGNSSSNTGNSSSNTGNSSSNTGNSCNNTGNSCNNSSNGINGQQLTNGHVISPPVGGSNGKLIPRPRASASPSSSGGAKDLFGAEPFSVAPSIAAPPSITAPSIQNGGGQQDLFGMGSFDGPPNDFNRTMSTLDQRIDDMKAGFSRGLSFGTDDFSLDDLDPLKN